MYFLIRNQGEQINGGERHKWEDDHKKTGRNKLS